MDPVSHLAFGRTLAALDRRRTLGAGAVSACVIGSLTPDIDALLMPFGWDRYLRLHQGGTHSLIGSTVCAALTAAAVRLLTKRGRHSALWLAAWAGAMGHLLLDVISGADIRFLWPAGPPLALPLFAMADPWLGGVLVLGAAMLALRRWDSARAAVAILVAVSALGGVKAILYSRTGVVQDASNGLVQVRRAEAKWGSLTTWTEYETRADTVDAYRVNALTGVVTPLVHLPRRLDDPLALRSLELESVRNLVAAHGVTFATVTGAGPGRQEVLWSDLRYCAPVDSRSASPFPWAKTGPTSSSPVSCALWFGGEFETAANAFSVSLVRVGRFEQHRSVR
jgi:membrane-bound metal-dependent hydrolase YbcI (DUF457 family)